jgi:2-keto-4-pentenoate hydratase
VSTPHVPSPLAAALVAARRSTRRVALSPTLLPADRRAAHGVQAEVAHALGVIVGGWKVGMLEDGTPMAAPIYADEIKPSGAIWRRPLDRPMLAEVELALRLAHDLPARAGRPYAREEIAAAVGEVLVGVEVLVTRCDVPRFPPFLAHLADNLGNAGYVTGGATLDFRARDLARLRCRINIGRELAHDRVGGHPQDDPWAPLAACLDDGLVPLGGFHAGQIVTTGALATPIEVTRSMRITASLEGIGDVDVTFE